jgi:hypothetical protein
LVVEDVGTTFALALNARSTTADRFHLGDKWTRQE